MKKKTIKPPKTGNRHPGESRDPGRKPAFKTVFKAWIPVRQWTDPLWRTFAGMTGHAGFLVLLPLLFPALVGAAPEIRAKVSASEISLQDSITFSIEITGVRNISPPWPLDIPGFNIQRAGQTQSFQIINGRSSSLVSFKYVLSPTQTGDLRIPAISLSHEGKTYTTNSLPIKVLAQAVPPSTNQSRPAQTAKPSVPHEGLKPIFMSAKVDQSKVYVGQQILLTIQFLRHPNVRLASQPRYSEPDMTGFIVESLNQVERKISLNGTPYIVTDLKYALFPTSDGEFAVGSASIEVAVRTRGDPFNPNSIFENFFGRRKTLRLKTRSLPIQVRALPKNKPDDFSGAVGRYRFTAKVDNPNPEVGKPLNLVLTLKGTGNVKSLREPTLPDLIGFRKYETISKSMAENQGSTMTGKKEFKILLIPQVSGSLEIPSIGYTFFDPQLSRYLTKNTKRISLEIQPGVLQEFSSDQAYQAPAGQTPEGIRVVEKDIRFIKSGKIKSTTGLIYQNGFFILANSLPPIFALGSVLTIYRRRKRLLFASDYKMKEAYPHAQKSLKKAKKQIGHDDPTQFYTTLSYALTGFLADKLNQKASGLVWVKIDFQLTQRGVPQELKDQTRAILAQADMARFATSAFADESKEDKLKEVSQLLKELDLVLK